MDTFQDDHEQPWNTTDLDCAETSPDLLDRTKLIDHLAQGLLRSRTGESLVTGIYGPWGSGKSWIKKRLISELRAVSPDLVIVEFSPWQIRGVDELTLQFFSHVFDKIDPPSISVATSAPSKRAQLWAQLARLSGVVPAAVRITGGSFGALTGDPATTIAALTAAGAGEDFAKIVAAKTAEAKEQTADAGERL
ncbi:MAG: P-loop NTPase fold protein, partial [Chthoniobacterales bacterium]